MTSRLDFATFDVTKYFPSLDGLRAFCVLLVMFNHVHGVVPRFIVGQLGVDVFFVLSGFLITTLLLREKERTASVSLKGFYTRRVFRIIPVYLFTVLLYVAAVYVTHDPVKTEQLKLAMPYLLTFMQEFRPDATGNVFGHAWTLGIEEKFYMLWPLLLIVLYPFRGRALLYLAGIFVAILLLPHTYARSYGGLMIGAAVAIGLAAPTRWRAWNLLAALPNWSLCLLVAATYTLNIYSSQCILLFSTAIALLVAALVLREGLLRKFLASAPLVFIGKRSYSMYLIHVLVLNFVEIALSHVYHADAITLVLLAYFVTLLGASVMYVVIEQPCIALGRRLSKRMGSPAPAIAQPGT